MITRGTKWLKHTTRTVARVFLLFYNQKKRRQLDMFKNEKVKNTDLIICIMDALILMLVPVSVWFLGLMGIGVAFILLILYIVLAKRRYTAQVILLIFCFMGVGISILGFLLLDNMTNTGIDGIGEALGYFVIFRAGSFLLLVCPIVLLIIDNRDFIFRKKFIISTLVLTIGVLSCIQLRYLFTTARVSEKTLFTVGDFENELNERGFFPRETDYRLYGVSGKNDKAIALSFDKHYGEKYPLYVYTVVGSKWIIYYANGETYAMSGYYWDEYTTYNKNSGYNEEKVICGSTFDPETKVLAETEKISVYSMKSDRYEKGDTIICTGFNYYSKNKATENSVFIDIPSIESWGKKIEQVDKISVDLLEKSINDK